MGGVDIPAGSSLHLRYAAANRDPRVFENPAELDVDRPNANRHLAFSTGETHCPGAGLSRLEQVIALGAMLDRLPEPPPHARPQRLHAPSQRHAAGDEGAVDHLGSAGRGDVTSRARR